MKYLRQFLESELHHYRKLNEESKIILLSIFLFNIAAPVLSTFISAFLWRTSQSVPLVILYNFANFLGVPLGFYLNGRLLKKYNPKTFYFFGSVTQGLVAGILLFLPSLNPTLVMVYGIIFGTMSGLYWGNRVLLTINHVKSSQRIYFTSLIMAQSIVCSIVIPFVIGWYLVLGERTNTYSPTIAYQILGIIILIVTFLAGKMMMKLSHEQQPIPYTTLKKPSKEWKKVRLMTFFMGISNSIDIVFPTMLVLLFVGKEGKLGTIQALSGIFIAIALNQIAKKVTRSYRFMVLLAGVGLSLLAGFSFSISYSSLGVLFYFVLCAFASPLRWTIFSPVMFDVIDGEVRKYAKNRYAFIFDQELFLNIGRNTSLFLFLLLYAYAPTTTMRFTPLVFAIPQVLVLWIAASLERKMAIEELTEKAHLYNYVLAVHEEK